MQLWHLAGNLGRLYSPSAETTSLEVMMHVLHTSLTNLALSFVTVCTWPQAWLLSIRLVMPYTTLQDPMVWPITTKHNFS